VRRIPRFDILVALRHVLPGVQFMFQFVMGRGGRSLPVGARTLRLAPVVIAMSVLFVPVSASAQTTPAPAPAPAPTAPPQTAPPAPPAKADAPPADAPPKGGPGGKKHGRPPAPPTGEPADLEAVMNGLKDNAKLLNGALASEDSKVALNSVIEMERLAALAKKFEPNNMAGMAEADKPAHIVEFRKTLIALLKQLTDIEASVLDGKFAPALDMMKGPLMQMRDDAHDKFQAKKEHR
jgi:hypothetical protein